MALKKDNFPGTYEIFDKTSNVVEEIFNNNFDRTWQQGLYDSKDSQRVWSLIPHEGQVDDGRVSYRYNDEYFRCDEFTNSHNGKHVLFAGCSETEGQGSNLENVWSYKVFNRIKDSIPVSGYFSLARGGYGWQKIITSLKIYISKYGKPDAMFVLLPNMGRYIDWSDDLDTWFAKQEYPLFKNNRSMDIENNPALSDQTPQGYKKAFIDFIISWRLFEDFCTASGIKLLWGTWQAIDNYNFSKFDIFSSFVSLPESEMFNSIVKYRKDGKLEEYDLKKRDGHHGNLYHDYWADAILEEAYKRGILDD